MTTVLIVDDSGVDRKLVGVRVERLGCEVIYATDGQEAIDQIKSCPPDMVLTDLQMPGVDGLELVKRIREDFPTVPVMLMTAHGSEEIAAQALRAGASSYVPKQSLQSELEDAFRVLMSTVDACQRRKQAQTILRECSYQFVLGYHPDEPQVLIGYLQELLAGLNFCDQSTMLRVTTALTEAIRNAIDHGNLELDSSLREEEGDAYRQLGIERAQQAPYCDRRAQVTVRISEAEASFEIRDDGNGFDPAKLPDPTDPENLLKASGRGILLMRTFMDEVVFNDVGNQVTMVKRRAAKA